MKFIGMKLGQATSYIELECPAKGNPKPQTKWLRNNQSLTELDEEDASRVSVSWRQKGEREKIICKVYKYIV